TFTDGNPSAPLSDFPLANVTINWGDGTITNPTSISQPGGIGTLFEVFGAHSYTKVGTFHLKVTAKDVGGAVSNTTNFDVMIVDPPVAAVATAVTTAME